MLDLRLAGSENRSGRADNGRSTLFADGADHGAISRGSSGDFGIAGVDASAVASGSMGSAR